MEEWSKVLDKIVWSFNEIAEGRPGDPNMRFMDKIFGEVNESVEFRDVEGASYKVLCYTDKAEKWLEEHKADQEQAEQEEKEYERKIAEGKALFAKYVESLWI